MSKVGIVIGDMRADEEKFKAPQGFRSPLLLSTLKWDGYNDLSPPSRYD